MQQLPSQASNKREKSRVLQTLVPRSLGCKQLGTLTNHLANPVEPVHLLRCCKNPHNFNSTENLLNKAVFNQSEFLGYPNTNLFNQCPLCMSSHILVLISVCHLLCFHLFVSHTSTHESYCAVAVNLAYFLPLVLPNLSAPTLGLRMLFTAFLSSLQNGQHMLSFVYY